MQKLFALLLAIAPFSSHAGVFELGASASYRKTSFSTKSFYESESYTGSLAYYFTEMSALEFSYTNGVQLTTTQEAKTTVYYTIYGLDFILSFGGKEAQFRPYLKAGVAQQYNEIHYQQTGFDPLPPEKVEGLSPSAGAGFRFAMTQTFGIKVGAEAIQTVVKDSSGNSETKWDYTGRAGVSWMF